MKKFIIQCAALVLVILGGFYYTYHPSDQLSLSGLISKPTNNPSGNSNIKQVKIGVNLIDVIVVDTPETRAKGLSSRDLDSSSGMLFIFPSKGIYQFWMKDMKIGLDFIFINDNKITDIIKNVPPPTDQNHLNIYQPSAAGNMVLEVNKGYIDKHNIKINDTVELIKN